jgi:hypothetical protein
MKAGCDELLIFVSCNLCTELQAPTVGTLQAECVQVHKIQEENLTAMTDVCPGNQTLRELAFCFIVDR